MYCDTRTLKHMHVYPHIENNYTYNNSHINCGNDKKNQRFYNQFGSYYPYMKNIKLTIIQTYKVTYTSVS